jgi:dihydrofolate reductase
MRFILAVSDDHKIALGNKLPWRISHDFKWFKMNTFNETVIMGRKTWDTLKKPLPNRRNIVVSRRKVPGVETIVNINKIKDYKYAWIIGGSQLCSQLWKSGDILVLTYVHITVPNGLPVEIPPLKCLWSKSFDGYTFTINKIR